MIVIVDYGMGNLESVKNAASFLGKKAVITSSPKDLSTAGKIIFPGVGHFGKAVAELKKRNLIEILKKRINQGVPFLGICLGMQVLAKSSQEGLEQGLGVIDTVVEKFCSKEGIVPHMGWNKVDYNNTESAFYYFIHSFYLPITDYTVGFTNYITNFSAVIKKNNLLATQFHPEKSGVDGLKILKEFGDLV